VFLQKTNDDVALYAKQAAISASLMVVVNAERTLLGNEIAGRAMSTLFSEHPVVIFWRETVLSEYTAPSNFRTLLFGKRSPKFLFDSAVFLSILAIILSRSRPVPFAIVLGIFQTILSAALDTSASLGVVIEFVLVEKLFAFRTPALSEGNGSIPLLLGHAVFC